MSDSTHIVAIDGPAGAGKSTVARRVAEALGIAFLDTGAMYRAATWWAMHRGIDMDNGPALAAATRAMPLEMADQDGVLRVAVDGQDVTNAIRSPEVTNRIYKLDQNADVRDHLVALQQAFGAKRPTVAEGRDIGTVVFPKARCKVYLDADLDERARRRQAQLKEKGVEADLEQLRRDIHDRDEKSRTRKVSPLRKADDAVLIDTTGMSVTDVIQAVVSLAREVL
ncbi:MAG: (d)CMP kinase [bacterium]|nr:(d)CMP kinase [bacterium]